MTDLQAKEIALKRARNSPSHVMGVIHRFIQKKVRDCIPPFGFPSGQQEPYDYVDILRMDQDLTIALLHLGLDCQFLRVKLTDRFTARITYKGMAYSDYLNALREKRGERVVYTT